MGWRVLSDLREKERLQRSSGTHMHHRYIDLHVSIYALLIFSPVPESGARGRRKAGCPGSRQRHRATLPSRSWNGQWEVAPVRR
jgi:hypothetical protein